MIPWELRHQHDEWGNNSDLLSKEDKEILETGEWIRASGDVICETCGEKYWRHPQVIGALWLIRICDGLLVKL